MLKDFNCFETLSIVHRELKHSIVLAWLLNTKENHGLETLFLKKFTEVLIERNDFESFKN
jgi:hypothetical protein